MTHLERDNGGWGRKERNLTVQTFDLLSIEVHFNHIGQNVCNFIMQYDEVYKTYQDYDSILIYMC